MTDFPPQINKGNKVVISSGMPEACCGAGVASLQNVSTAYPAANRAFYVPFLVQEPMIALRMKIQNGATINGNFDMGIYDDQKNRLVSTGSTVHAGADALQTFDIADTTLLPGLYYMAVCSSSATATISNFLTAAAVVNGCGVLIQAVGAVTLPNPAVWATNTGTFIPNIAVLLRTTA